MSPIEAAILQKKLEWCVARGDKMGGDDAAYARLGQFYVIKHEPKLAIAALEKAVKFWGRNPNDVFNPAEGSWRWQLLVELYIEEGDYKSAAAMFDNSARLDSNARTFGGDETWYCETAADVYAKVGSTEKAERAKRLLQRIELMPRGFDTDRNSLTRLRELRKSAFDYAAVCLRENKPEEALHVLSKLFSDRQALRLKVDKPQFLAAANMLISVGQVQARDWSAAEKSFPRALRLAAKERTLVTGEADGKPSLYKAYAELLEHQGKSSQAKQYLHKAEVAANAPREDIVFYEATGKTEGPAPPDYDQNDLYPPELLK